ncbi:MAG: hypothetical protein AAFR79_06395 [Pseudomonadota bacterium]
MATPGAWAAEWENAKNTFEKTSGQKKPSGSILGFSKKSGISASFKKMDVDYKKMIKLQTEGKTDSKGMIKVVTNF